MTSAVCRTSVPTALTVTISKAYICCTENCFECWSGLFTIELMPKRLIHENLWCLALTKQGMVASSFR